MSKGPSHFFPLYIGDYLADTTMLTRDQHGGYLLLIMAYWRNRGPLPDNDQALAVTTRSTPAEWKKLRPVLAAFFVVKDGVWLHKRIDRELQSADQQYAARIERSKTAAAKRWSKRSVEDATSMPQACNEHASSNAQEVLEECQLQQQLQSAGKPAEGGEGCPRKQQSPNFKKRFGMPDGQRWPADAVVPDDWLVDGEQYRLSAGLNLIDLRVEALKFANYWASKPGDDAVKTDWKRTWLNWCLTATGGQNGQRNSGKSQLEQIAEIVRNGL